MVTLAFMGDVMLGRNVSHAITENGPEYPWGDTLSLLERADLRLINLECTISDKGKKWQPKVFNFRASPAAINALLAAGIDYVSLANNHTLDYRDEALLDTIHRLDEAGIKHSGAGATILDAAMPAMLEAGGLKILVVSLTDTIPEWRATENRPGTNFIPLWAIPQFFQNIKGRSLLYRALNILVKIKLVFLWNRVQYKMDEAINIAKAKGSDLVVFSCHLGPNWLKRPSSYTVKFAQHAIDSGIDIYYGHGSHLFHGIETHNRKPIFYDTGDFIDDYKVANVKPNNWSFIYFLDLDEKSKRPLRAKLVPVLISNSQVNIARNILADRICTRMATLCTEMGTKTHIEKGTLLIDFNEIP